MPVVKTLLDPLLLRDIPHRATNIPGRNKKSWAYQDDNSRYFFGSFPTQKIPVDSSDQFYTLVAGDVGRPDLISYKFYGTPAFYWVILWINDIADPFEGMYPGMLLRIPTRLRLIQYDIPG